MDMNEQATPEKRPDPFGRLMEKDDSRDRYKALENITMISAGVGPTAENKPEDVAKVETMLGMLGEMSLTETEGPTGYFGERLRQAIATYQAKNKIPQSGSIFPNDVTMRSIAQSLPTNSEPDNRQSTARFQP
ncbi:MAG: hypothetical protein HON65_10900 [Rhodospirillales bacterium]|nr:hypothetical protein [Rhodospirillales bacterium]